MMRILGVDLAAQPATTGAVLIATEDRKAWSASELQDPATDDNLVGAARRVEVVGIDAPLGWPAQFVAAVRAHSTGEPWPGGVDRRSLTHRETDWVVKRRTGLMPLSVSADRLGVRVMRCALLQHRWATEVWGQPAPRNGTGALVETYPAAALRAWAIDATGYKGRTGEKTKAGRDARRMIVDQVSDACGSWLSVESIADRCIDSDHVLDALVSALVAIAAKAGMTEPATNAELANLEGWIHVPSGPLAALRPRETS